MIPVDGELFCAFAFAEKSKHKLQNGFRGLGSALGASRKHGNDLSGESLCKESRFIHEQCDGRKNEL